VGTTEQAGAADADRFGRPSQSQPAMDQHQQRARSVQLSE